MKKPWRDMKYNDFLDCWMVFWDNGKSDYKLRCGDSFELHLGDGKRLVCRIELGSDWYILMGQNDTKFYLKPNETYQVNI
ncbi:DUF5348 domain-containing protein [Neobacillus sp. MM2021_6]|uniref:DUF5348 domain-containing protein n=2 Tax=Bacillaceae TaxID=186817 RepID=UPI001A94FD77|nr:DUF5348 domain-containing protein [Neobacillus sp. MM2021_6]MBO0962850.1 DUF5348 domain-containing protein [Neobacillus sp. MM2021_6]